MVVLGRYMGRSLEETRQKVAGVPLTQRRASRRCSSPPAMSCDNTCEVWSPREARLSLGVQSSYWGLDTQKRLPSMYQNSRLPEGKRWLFIGGKFYTVCWLSSWPPVQGQPCKQAFSVNSFLHREVSTYYYFYRPFLLEKSRIRFLKI